MRCVFAGTPSVAATSLAALLDSRHEVVAVLTRPDAPAGRGREVAASPVATLAREQGIEVLQPTTLRDPQVLGRLTAIAPDVAPIVACGPGSIVSVTSALRAAWSITTRRSVALASG